MSARLLGLGFACDMGTPHRKLVLLKLIDACEDDGTRIFPAVATIARAAQCSARQVQRELAKMVEIGLLAIVREGGKGPRSTREYALDVGLLRRIEEAGWGAVCAEAGGEASDEAKGDRESPLSDGEKGDSGDTKRVTGTTDKGDRLSHPTPPDSSTYPSERESARESGEEGKPETAEPDDRKAVQRAFEKAFRDWPTSISDSRPEAWKAWLELSPEERGTAAAEAGRYVEACRAAGRKHVCSHGVYLREKRWTGLGPKPDEKPAALDAKAFGPLWQAARMKQLLAGVQRVPAGLTATQRALVEMGKADEAELQREQQARSGWPTVNAMHERAEFGRGVSAAPSLEPLAALMEPVPVGSERFEEWKLEHRLRGWPWLPETGRQPVVYFPAGGPAGGLAAFKAAVRGEGGEAHTANEAAE